LNEKQCRDSFLDRLRLVRLKPASEREDAARLRRAHRDADVAGDVRLVGAGRPHHDNLRFRVQDCVRAVALLAQRVDLDLA
jgi:hypothetical protein